MKIHIFYTFKEGSWGGGNQFLKVLKSQFEQKGVYAPSAKSADVILFNGYQELKPLIKSWVFDHGKKRAYRLGPVMSLHRKGMKWKIVDHLMAIVATVCADVVIFQSHWSYTQAKKFGFGKKKNFVIIPNAVDQSIFYKKESLDMHSPISLVYTSWSSNANKGFSLLNYLDRHLDFNKYQVKFVGNSPVQFENIKVLAPMQSKELAEELRSSDIFISPTKDDACSNAILEALSCGLPVVALASGGNGELIDGAGVLFSDEKEVIGAIDTVATDIDIYAHKIKVSSIEHVAERYIAAIRASIR